MSRMARHDGRPSAAQIVPLRDDVPRGAQGCGSLLDGGKTEAAGEGQEERSLSPSASRT